MSHAPYFRAGAGTIIYTDAGEILRFRRSDKPDIWQFPQGGMDDGETPEETMWRELYEETTLTKDDISLSTEYPKWTVYTYPSNMELGERFTNVLGQAHRWWFLKLKSGTSIDLSKAHDQEFSDYKVGPFSDLLQNQNDIKQHVYKELQDYFDTHIIPTL